jgi:hypothetical protein
MEWLDEQVHFKTSLGLASRELALRVLGEFGVDLGRPGGP